jgi:hypothetical protein
MMSFTETLQVCAAGPIFSASTTCGGRRRSHYRLRNIGMVGGGNRKREGIAA